MFPSIILVWITDIWPKVLGNIKFHGRVLLKNENVFSVVPVCFLQFGSWDYDNTKMILGFLDGEAQFDISHYQRSKDWILLKYDACRRTVLVICQSLEKDRIKKSPIGHPHTTVVNPYPYNLCFCFLSTRILITEPLGLKPELVFLVSGCQFLRCLFYGANGRFCTGRLSTGQKVKLLRGNVWENQRDASTCWPNLSSYTPVIKSTHEYKLKVHGP